MWVQEDPEFRPARGRSCGAATSWSYRNGPAQPCSGQGVRAGGQIGAVLDEPGESRRQRPCAFGRHRVDDRCRVGGIEALDRVGHGVDPADHRQADRERDRQLCVVDDGAWQDRSVAARPLLPVLGDTPARGHLRTGVGRGNRQHRQARRECHGRTQTDRGSAADCHTPLSAGPLRCLVSTGRVSSRNVHPGVR